MPPRPGPDDRPHLGVTGARLVPDGDGIRAGHGTSPGDGESLRPAQTILMGMVARRYYQQGRSKVDIAQELGLSRFKVARLLDQARDTGLVRIEIRSSGPVEVDLSVRLRDRYQIPAAVAATPPSDGTGVEVRRAVAQLAARHLEETLTTRDVLGLPWSRSVYAMVRALRRLPRVPVVQLSGALTIPDQDCSAVETVIIAARLARSRAHVFYAPFIADDEDAAATFRRQRAVAAAMNEVTAVTTAVVGIGVWEAGLSTVYDAITPAERTAVTAAEAVGEMAGVFFDGDGTIVEPPLTARLVNISGARFRQIPTVVAMGAGAERAEAVQAALRGRLIDVLIVDASLATELLAQ